RGSSEFAHARHASQHIKLQPGACDESGVSSGAFESTLASWASRRVERRPRTRDASGVFKPAHRASGRVKLRHRERECADNTKTTACTDQPIRGRSTGPAIGMSSYYQVGAG